MEGERSYERIGSTKLPRFLADPGIFKYLIKIAR